MYFHFADSRVLQGATEIRPEGVLLKGKPKNPAFIKWHFTPSLARWVVGLKFCVMDSHSCQIRLDSQTESQNSWGFHLNPPDSQKIISINYIPQKPNWISLTHFGPAPLLLCDLILHPRGFGNSPIEDARLIEEGRCWDRYFEAFIAEKDHSILDGEIKNTHPSFLNAGIRHPDSRDIGHEYAWHSDKVARFLLSPFQKTKGIGLDVGCGGGQFALQAARQGARMVGVDLGAGMLKIAHAYALKQEGVVIDHVRAEGTNLPFRDEVFNTIGSKDSLHHVADISTGLQEIHRVLKPGGTFVAMEHASDRPVEKKALGLIHRLLMPRITKRFLIGPIPKALTRASPLEDAGATGFLKAFRGMFINRKVFQYPIFTDQVWMYTHYAFGRLRPLAVPFLCAAAWVFEKTAALSGGPFSVCVRGEKKE